MKSDFQISNECEKKHIAEVAGKLGIKEEDLILYGNHKAKIQTKNIKKDISEDAKLVLVTSINPTSSGEGKSTVTIGLSDGLNRIGKKSCVALREPSLGPVLGRKGGAAGGGYAQVVPMEDINLHFTGDMHAITTAHNAIAVLVNNHVFQGNELEIDRIVFNRVMDMNARDLRHIKVNAGTDLERLDGFDITVASEVMAILCLSEGIADLKEKLSNILVAYNKKGEPVYLKDLKIEGVITSLLKDAIKPNIVQTLENNPAIIHGGPFANIAHGCNSILATKTALKFADYTEERFQQEGFRVVPSATVRKGAYIAKNTVLMPSYVNIGAYVGEGTMVDTWATVGSCAQIGKNVHLSGGVGIGGVLEPLQANPTIIGDNCFIGARSEVVEGVIVEDGCVISMGVFIGQSTKIYDRETGEIHYGRVPAGSVVVSGSLPSKCGKYSLYCAVIVKKVDAKTLGKVGINELLRSIEE